MAPKKLSISDRVSTLPRWAQDYIRVLAMRLEEAKKCSTLFTSESVSLVRLRLGMMGEQNIPPHSIIRFDLGDGVDNTIDVSLRGKMVDVYGRRHLVVLPEASNHIHLQTGGF